RLSGPDQLGFVVYVSVGNLVDFFLTRGGRARCWQLASWCFLEGEGREGISLEPRRERARTCVVSTSGEYSLQVRKEICWDRSNRDIDLCYFFSLRDALGMRIGGWKLFGRCFFFCKRISSSAFQLNKIHQKSMKAGGLIRKWSREALFQDHVDGIMP
ncbi:PREDICTED: uncharacterized protein LOC104477202, partial [Chlamydotis macqueenii]|uniref:uncharacterized protein LOC104477202 n=1 Tax=Chlamydotis macqueenii TaxID=187382 RepID=UPI000529A33F